MAKWRCLVCAYVYDPEAGDPDNGVEPGTPFRSIPDDWVCSLCGAGKDEFEEIREQEKRDPRRERRNPR